MTSKAIFLPALAMVALTCAVWIRLYVVRIGQMRRERIHPQAVATSSQAAAKLTDSAAADNFRNLFELPVLFYLALTVAALSGLANAATLALAWAFVALRVLHSLIHCGYNRVMHRFIVYIAGAVALWALWIHLAIGLLRS
ncbi:MAPEG family protein [Lysobacter sp. BMK333-48F3]|uniref:MAPEG family protein n=1 Tax=Lysobacter sp. BMK333-48F3 TaxID=2867962 RepID=UPI001C8C37BE|nr:MAPEG family protein [Lysobacter sp. BMK333-48F3]MBX9403559.1 MAPEG family protein [Lysobacter sp. BMK333-48F3]